MPTLAFRIYHDKEVIMFELLKSLGFALLMVPVVMVLIMGIIYGLGEIFNLISPSQSKADKEA